MLPRLKIKFSKDQDIIDLSCGEVTAFKAYNFKYNTAQPVPNGLFCQKIFGPVKDFTCACGIRHPLFRKVCPKCGVPIIKASERANRFGHISTHSYYINPLAFSLVASLIGVNQKTLHALSLGELHFLVKKAQYETNLISESGEYYYIDVVDISDEKYDKYHCSVDSLVKDMKEIGIDGTKSLEINKSQWAKRYFENGYSLYDLFNSVVPVPPPTTRDISICDSDISYHPVNNLYLRLIRIGSRIQHIMESPVEGLRDLIPQESTLLQHIVNMLYVEGGVDYYNNDIPPILSSMQGKGGLIRGNLLGKRVDYSGRSAISSGPDLPLDTLGIPYDMAYELLKPFILHYIIEDYEEDGEVINPIKEAYRSYKHRDYRAQKACEMAAKEAMVMMNRAPSLHRYSVMAFKIRLHHGKQIQVPPMICSPFNADFDGDTVAIHVILTDKANNEANKWLRPADNIMSSICDSKPNLLPAHEQIIGLYELTK